MSKCYIVKVGIVGNYNVGKSSFLNSYIEQEGCKCQLSTIGVDFRSKVVDFGENSYKLHIWDTAGQEQFANIVRGYLREVDIIIFMYDTTNIKSFQDLPKWINEVDHFNKKKNVIKYIVGHKKDDDKNREVDFRKVKKYCKEIGIKNSETSVNDLDSLNSVFENLIEEVDDNVLKDKIKLKIFYNLEVRENILEEPKDKNCCTIF
jgi:Ras-related protein Rab-8A